MKQSSTLKNVRKVTKNAELNEEHGHLCLLYYSLQLLGCTKVVLKNEAEWNFFALISPIQSYQVSALEGRGRFCFPFPSSSTYSCVKGNKYFIFMLYITGVIAARNCRDKMGKERFQFDKVCQAKGCSRGDGACYTLELGTYNKITNSNKKP